MGTSANLSDTSHFNKYLLLFGPRVLNQIKKKVIKVKPGLDPKSLRNKPRSY